MQSSRCEGAATLSRVKEEEMEVPSLLTPPHSTSCKSKKNKETKDESTQTENPDLPEQITPSPALDPTLCL